MTDRRVHFREGLSPLYLPFYDALCARLPAEWAPYSGFRSFQAQDLLYAQGRDAPGKIVTNARAGESAHNWGMGSDWTLWAPGGVPIWMKAEDPRWQEYIDAVTAVGLRPGAEFGDIDHNELRIAHSWVKVHEVYQDTGRMEDAVAFIQASMLSRLPAA